jgi:hypothetical protein
MDDFLHMTVFDVFYVEDDGRVDYARFSAEDEQHARKLFAVYYVGYEIVSVEQRGDAF